MLLVVMLLVDSSIVSDENCFSTLRSVKGGLQLLSKVVKWTFSLMSHIVSPYCPFNPRLRLLPDIIQIRIGCRANV